MTPQETEPKHLLVLEGLCGGWISRGLPQGWGTGSGNPGRSLLAYALLEVIINPTIEPVVFHFACFVS